MVNVYQNKLKCTVLHNFKINQRVIIPVCQEPILWLRFINVTWTQFAVWHHLVIGVRHNSHTLWHNFGFCG